MIQILFGIVMTVAHFFSESLSIRCGRYRPAVISFSAGVSLSYIFLDLFPAFSEGVSHLDRFLFTSVLIGFASLHLVEKYIYTHVARDKRRRDLALEDSAISFIYHFIVGILITSLFIQGFQQGLLFFIPMLLYTAFSTLPVTPPKIRGMKLGLSLSTTLGVLAASYVFPWISLAAVHSLLGFVIGVLLFTVIRHSMPLGREGRPLFFILGTIGYSLLIMFTWVWA